MKKIETILVPIDLTSATKNLTDYALHIAESFGAVITFIHIVPEYPGDVMVGSPYGEEYQKEAYLGSKKKIEALVSDSQKLCPGCNGEVVYGNPVDKIIEFAEKKADLLIIGTHGAKGLEKIILGNVAEHVLRKSPCPVLIMNPYKHLSHD